MPTHLAVFHAWTLTMVYSSIRLEQMRQLQRKHKQVSLFLNGIFDGTFVCSMCMNLGIKLK